ncbi:reverse transcriptase N-terminal domain-containing protein, partial [Psychroserpens sp.]
MEWENIDWKVANTHIRKLQRRIFKATRNARNGNGSWNKVRSLM